jgi:hypothetical protein
MMNFQDVRQGSRRAVIVALLVTGSHSAAESAAITSSIDYSTSGTIGSGGPGGSSVLNFRGVGGGTLTTGGTPFDLGRFEVAPMAPGTTMTYHFTPFDLSFATRSVDGVATPEARPVVVRGWIDGTITGDDPSKLKILFPGINQSEDSPFPGIAAFPAGHLLNYLDAAPGSSWSLQPPADGGQPPLRGIIQSVRIPEPTPEPASILIFAGLAAPAFYRRFRGSRGATH